ncbi:hypothetical protein O0I10_008035 [Lichtheimia ornata]|uniref:Methyltransferase domain-containing protein n=1 Tax=Lichtheimia ornata TaxID=688661 RepID=A0AAD7XXA4_9FUNG|nr:uncharacterized protein O0I10_008035 [Lichtheimia ornata]KAJ8656241.1 hypothetical protein O0I10_008035 [Lichtheimia ornata]
MTVSTISDNLSHLKPTAPSSSSHGSQEEDDHNGRPLAYVMGETEFCGLSFKVSEACLIPRPCSKILVDAAESILLEEQQQQHSNESLEQKRVLDIGTGSGNLLLALMHRMQNVFQAPVKGVGIDISGEALEVARDNQTRLNIANAAFFECDMSLLDSNQVGMFDVIMCAPPYLDEVTLDDKDKDMLAHEPAVAVYAGDGGLQWYPVLKQVVPKVLNPHGKLVLKVNRGMMDKVKDIMTGWKTVNVIKDDEGYDRCLVLEQI